MSEKAKRKPTFIDLFAGAGGLSEGFIQAGFEPIATLQMRHSLICTFKKMYWNAFKKITAK